MKPAPYKPPSNLFHQVKCMLAHFAAGARSDGPSSTVYKARLGEEDVIVKMGCTPREVSLIKQAAW